MRKFSNWPTLVAVMVSVLVVVLLVPGLGSAAATTLQSVIVANTAAKPAQVHVTNASATTSEIASGATALAAGGTTGDNAPLFSLTDVSQYRQVSLYLSGLDGKNSVNEDCVVTTQDSKGQLFLLDRFTTSGVGTIAVKAYDPAPPKIEVQCTNQNADAVTIHWELAGRTG
jgi:hypothetical protein